MKSVLIAAGVALLSVQATCLPSRTDPVYDGFVTTSRYLTMRDGVKIAVDVHLPRGPAAGERMPAIFQMTRYVRSYRPRALLRPFWNAVNMDAGDDINFFTDRGYAFVIADARGTGASFASRRRPWPAAEHEDGAEIVEWITRQSWSNGRVGATGISYPGTAALKLAAARPPGLKAIFVRAGIFDAYRDLVFPGGIRQGPLLEAWGRMTKAMDSNQLGRMGWLARLAVTGVRPAHSDQNLFARAVAEHANNYDVRELTGRITFRDDVVGDSGTLDDSSPFTLIEEIRGSNIPIYWLSGWYDGALADSAISAFSNLPNVVRLTLGPWNHGPTENASPFSDTREVRFDLHEEMLVFFDRHLRSTSRPEPANRLVRYFTVGAEKWRTADAWPPGRSSTRRFYLGQERSLFPEPPAKPGRDRYAVDHRADSGPGSRWNSLTGPFKKGPTGYPDRFERDKSLLVYESEVLAEDLEITGHPAMSLIISSDSDDPRIFAYLEERFGDGRVYYVTEGMHRAIHGPSRRPPIYRRAGPVLSFLRADARKLKAGKTFRVRFVLLPVSYRFSKGSRIRIALAGADAGHFDPPRGFPAGFLSIHRGPAAPSFLSLPLNSPEESG